MSDDDELYLRDRAAREEPWNSAAFWHAFRHNVAIVNGGVRIHAVSGGDGPPVAVLHGFPEHS